MGGWSSSLYRFGWRMVSVYSGMVRLFDATVCVYIRGATQRVCAYMRMSFLPPLAFVFCLRRCMVFLFRVGLLI